MTIRNISVGASVTTTSADLYTTPSNFVADVETLHVCNKSGSAKTVTVQWFDVSAGLTHSLLNTTNIPSYDYIQLDNPLFLDAGDKIKVVSTTSGDIDVTARIKEIFTPIRTS